MPLDLQPPEAEHEYLDWAFERAIELLEEGQEAAADDLLSIRPPLQQQVRGLIDLARKVAFGPKTARPILPGYVLLEELGEGGMGTVWLARQQNLGGRLVAVKVLPRSLGFSPRWRSRFRTEAQAIGKLRHPHIIDVYDVIEADGVHAYAMEWVEGSTLAAVIERVKDSSGNTGTRHQALGSGEIGNVQEVIGNSASFGAQWPVPDASSRTYIVFVCRVGVAISRALGAVHRAGLVHRDVKPSNILLRSDGTPLLSDFGLVRDPESSIVTQAGASGGFAGTVAYAAPEQLRADGGEIDRRADIYSLGATLYSALALRLPFEGRHHVDVLRQIQLGLVTPLRKFNSRLPRDLETIVAKAMDPDPARRYQAADDLADDLDRLLNLQPIKAKPAGWVSRATKLARRNRAALVAATLGGTLALAAVALALVYFIGFPVWSKTHLDRARLVLLDPEQSDALFSALLMGQPRASGLALAPAATERALAQYDAAARFAPFDDDIALERDLVRLVLHITTRAGPAPVAFEANTDLRLTIAYAAHPDSGWTRFGSNRDIPDLDDEQLRGAPAEDLRSLGLVALLCGDPGITMKAWTALDLKGSSDPMIEASFGMVYLISKQYGRAYPRLRKAVEAFPNVGFLTVYLAEAATKCGDFDKAQQWLNEARSMPRLDRFNGRARVQAGLYAAAGKDDDARRLYEELLAENKNIVAFDEYVRFLEAHGDLERAVLVYLRLVAHYVVDVRMSRRFIDATERWWQGLAQTDRQQLLQANEPWTAHRFDRNGILPTYAKCVRESGGEPPADGVPYPPKSPQ